MLSTPPVKFIVFAVTTRLPVFNPSETPSRFAVVAKPVPTVNVTPFAKVTFPRLIAPVAAPPRTDVAVTETGVPASPKVITEAPVLAAIVPAIFTAVGAVTSTPAVKVVKSSAASPIVTVPVLLKVVVPAIVPPPTIDTLFTPPPTFRPVVKTRLPAKEAVPETLVNVTVPALKLLNAVTPAAEVKVTVPSGVDPPTIPLKLTLPVPAVSPRSCAPFNELPKTTFPLFDVMLSVAVERVAGPLTVNPPKPLQLKPSNCTAPSKELPVSPAVKVTF